MGSMGSMGTPGLDGLNCWDLDGIAGCDTSTEDTDGDGDCDVDDCRGQQGPPGQDAFAPTGAIIAFAGVAAPSGWLLCDGSAVGRTQYAELFAIIGTSFGGGDSVNTFNLPDLRGRFLRGVDNGTGNDPDANARVASQPGGSLGDTVGTLQYDAFQGHAHSYADPGHSHDYCSGAFPGGVAFVGLPGSLGCGQTGVSGTGISIQGPSDNGSGSPRTTIETRPINVSVNYIIKI